MNLRSSSVVHRVFVAVTTAVIVLGLASIIVAWSDVAYAQTVNLTDPNLFIPKNITWYVKTETIEVVVTAYSPAETCGGKPCIGANGKAPVSYRTGACPRRLTFGTRFRVRGAPESWGERGGEWLYCSDRTHARFDGRFDVFVPTYEEARAWGKRKTQVTIEYAPPVPRVR